MASAVKRIAVLISGRGSNMEAILKEAQDGILKDCCQVVLVVSNRCDAPGLNVAQDMAVKTVFVESKGKGSTTFDRQLLDILEPYRLDYVVLAGFMRILSPLVIERYRQRIVNIHPADTAQYQGVHGYRWAFEKHLSTTKITVHYVDEGTDTGPVIAQTDVDLTSARTLEEVENRGLAVEHRFYSQVLHQVFTGRRGRGVEFRPRRSEMRGRRCAAF